MRPASDRRKAPTMRSSSMRWSLTGWRHRHARELPPQERKAQVVRRTEHVGCITNTSHARTFSSICTNTSPAEGVSYLRGASKASRGAIPSANVLIKVPESGTCSRSSQRQRCKAAVRVSPPCSQKFPAPALGWPSPRLVSGLLRRAPTCPANGRSTR